VKAHRIEGGRVPDRIVGIRPAFQQKEPSVGALVALQVLCMLGVLQALVWAAHEVWCGEAWIIDQVKAWF
jgi:hypothetical protein